MAFDNPNVINRFGKSRSADYQVQVAINLALERHESFRVYYPLTGDMVDHYIDPVSKLAYAEESKVQI